MTDYNPCQGCDFFNKPYWSIVNPCKNCPKQFTGGFVTTTTTNVPSVEYGPVRHGRWNTDGSCSECGEFDNKDPYGSKYCPNCGAKMDKEA